MKVHPRYRYRLPFSPVVELPTGEEEGETPMEKERGERAKSECVGMRLLALAMVGVFFSK